MVEGVRKERVVVDEVRRFERPKGMKVGVVQGGKTASSWRGVGVARPLL